MYFVTDDLARWGIGLHDHLPAAFIDANFWELLSRVVALEDHPEAGRGVDDITILADQMTFHYSDATTQTLTVPVAMFHDVGAWPANTPLSYLDMFDYGGALYYVLLDHTSASTFDAGATDGSGHPLYRLVIATPSTTIAAGGTTGQFYRKNTDSDFDAGWYGSWITDQQDVLVDSTLTDGDVFTWDSGLERWTNKPLDLPAPSSGGRGGVESIGPVTHEWINSIGTDGVPTLAQPAFSDLSSNISVAQLRQSTVTTLGTSGAVSIDPTLGRHFFIQPTGDTTLSMASLPSGGEITLRVGTSGTTSWNITFGTNFKSTGTLATGTVSGKFFMLTFYTNGSSWYEVSRTTAQ